MLDEPTNDLDVETLELLEELLADYDGTLLVVSHDRRFLDATVTSTMVLSGDGRVEEHVGGYSDWLRYREAEQAQALRSAPPASSRPAAAPATPAAKPKKLGYKEQRELDALPARIEALEQTQADLQQRTADPDFYRSAPGDVAAALEELADVEAQLEQAYARWESLDR